MGGAHMLTLRPYQEALIADVREALRGARSVLAQLPTAGGKTACWGHMAGRAAERGVPSLFNVHRQELIDQTCDTLRDLGLSFGILAAGYRPNPLELIQVAGIDTLRARLRAGVAIRRPGLVGWDECHHLAAGGWLEV